MKIHRASLFVCLAALLCAPAMAEDDSSYGSSSYSSSSYAAAPGNSNTRMETRFKGLEEQMRVLNGRVEQVEYAVRRLDQAMQRMQNDYDARLQHLESAMTQQAAVQQQAAQQQAVAAQQPVAEANGTLGAIKTQNGRIVGGVNNPQSTPLPQTAPDYGLNPQEQYERAFKLLQAANYAEAEQAFKSFIDKNPKDKLLDNAKYWYGETLYVRARFDESAVAFADAYQQNPQGNKAADSLLKLGMSLGAMNKVNDACVTLNELKAKYPKAAQSTKARAEEEISRLKCPAR